MHASIFCPGPAVIHIAARPDVPLLSDLTIAVNRACRFTGTDVWACGDPELLMREVRQVRGSPILLTTDAGAIALAGCRDVFWRGEVMCIEFLRQLYEGPGERDNFSSDWWKLTAMAAIVYAAVRGAKQIDCYGMDWHGTKDFDGVQAGLNRSDERWRWEKGIFSLLQSQFAGRGITLNRIAPPVIG